MKRSTSVAMCCWRGCLLAAFVFMNASAEIAGKELGKAEIARATAYRTTQIDGSSIFYREAGPKDGPTLLLLHGLFFVANV